MRNEESLWFSGVGSAMLPELCVCCRVFTSGVALTLCGFECKAFDGHLMYAIKKTPAMNLSLGFFFVETKRWGFVYHLYLAPGSIADGGQNTTFLLWSRNQSPSPSKRVCPQPQQMSFSGTSSGTSPSSAHSHGQCLQRVSSQVGHGDSEPLPLLEVWSRQVVPHPSQHASSLSLSLTPM